MSNDIEQNPTRGPGQSMAAIPELNIIYSAIDKLSFAQTSAEMLDVVSDYPRSSGAVVGTLSYIDSNADSLPEWVEVVAKWGLTVHPYSTVGHRVHISQAPASELIVSTSDAPLLIFDATVSDLLSLTTREACRHAQICGLAFLPLQIRSRWVGVLSFGWSKPHAFQEQDQRIYTVFARQIGLMADSMRIFEAEHRRATVLETVAAVGAAATYNSNMNELLQTVADLTKDRFALGHTHIYLLDEEGEKLALAAATGDVGRQLKQYHHYIPLSTEHSLVAKAGRTHQDVIVNDVTNEPDFLPNPLLPETHSQMAVPMVAGETLLGVLDVQSDKPGQFSDPDVRVMATLADQTSIIIQNVHASQRVRAVERTLEDRNEFLQSLIDAIPNPVFYKDMQGRYQGFNVAFLNYLGKTREEILGKSVYDLSPKELADIYYAKDQEVFQNPDSIQIYENQVKYADGTRHRVIFTKAILTSVDGSLWGLVGVITDITARRQAEEALRESEERFRLIMETSLDGIALANSQGQILMANPALCQMLGRGGDELRSLKQTQLVDESDVRFARFLAELQETGKARGELMAFCADNTKLPIEMTMTVFTKRDNPEQLRSFIIRDISERRRYQEALIEREKLRTALEKETELSQIKSRMMERIAHEFRTPLTIIELSTEWLGVYQDQLTSEQKAAKVRDIHMQVRHLSALLDQIGLAMDGNLVPDDLQITTIDLSALCRETAHELEAQLAQSHQYVLELPESVMVRADPTLLQNALFHIMHNAAQFSAASAIITVNLSIRDQGVELIVSDSGIGILPQEQARIFEAFFRGSNIGVVSGLGLGLTIARACIELHQGTINVESVPGQGTTVRIWLPQMTG